MSKRKLLLADDSVTIQKVVDLTFQDEGFDVISVGDGNSAMDKLREDQPDLILADVNMPGLNGYEICDKIKNSGDFDEIPVVLLVGSFEPFDKEEADRVGADTHLTKPFQSISQLVNVVYGLVGPGSGEAERAMSAAQSSEAGTFELPANPPDFGSLESDDEMIQTDQIGSLPVDEVSRFETQPTIEEANTELSGTDSIETSDSLEDNTFAEFDSSIDNNPVTFSDNENESDDDSEQDFKEFTLVEPAESYGVTMGSVEDNKAADNDMNDEEPITSETDTETASFDGFESSSFDGAETAELPSHGDDLMTLDELNLLEVPIAEDDSDEENHESVENDEDVEASEQTDELLDSDSETEELDASEGLEETGFDFAGEESGSESPSAETANEVSDELVEKIAQRVVEMMSDKVVKEVAWEVVPQMSDLIIKEMAREKLKD